MLQDPVGPDTDIDMVMSVNPLSFAKSLWIRPLLTGPNYQQRPTPLREDSMAISISRFHTREVPYDYQAVIRHWAVAKACAREVSVAVDGHLPPRVGFKSTATST